MLILPSHFDGARDWLAKRLDTVKLAPTGDVAPSGEATTPAAVLVPIVLHDSGPTVLFTKRTDKLAKHAGQISFPGGRIELDETPEQAALRETEEEVGIAAQLVMPVGRLAQYVTISGYRVTPVVGLLQPGFEMVLQADEVAEAFEVPLAFLLDKQNFTDKIFNLPEQRTVTYALNWQGRIIWGATAGMLMTLYLTLCSETDIREVD
ncbi:CoA pyrophosphatase [Chitinimonas sp. BJB300]|uniref:CoA pyrophosphatase n=1 Tax=Chitinimonas sp. BJB300 TaxID=1559339 RepID=UPI000C0E7186|nr:CoA pyrophosphatase [Chitinimonas sp. BJB300]PHV13459.1 CoA pyrophosphatase [Chitinimonas sp. BJB300]TSJ89856.1 CoA pyrophosphatase [Chitinimonas sp. BJB300]